MGALSNPQSPSGEQESEGTSEYTKTLIPAHVSTTIRGIATANHDAGSRGG